MSKQFLSNATNSVALVLIGFYMFVTMMLFVGSLVIGMIWECTVGFCLRCLRRVRAQ